MLYPILKALHIIFMVSYFAGLFYLVRLFVYYKDTDAFSAEKQTIIREQYVFMIHRLWNIITVPAGILMFLFGVAMLIANSSLLSTPWFHLKLTFLLGLAAYHYWSWKKVLQIKNLGGVSLPISNLKLRQSNEIATVILFAVVFTVILKSTIFAYWCQLLLGFFAFAVLMMATVKLVNRNKKKND